MHSAVVSRCVAIIDRIAATTYTPIGTLQVIPTDRAIDCAANGEPDSDEMDL
jgi:hypothetical protein